MAINITDDLIELQRTVEAERVKAVSQLYSVEAWKPWMDVAERFQGAVTAHAEATEQSRVDVEARVKLAALHPEEYAAKLEKEAAKK